MKKIWSDAEIVELKVSATAAANEQSPDYDDWIPGADGWLYGQHGDPYPSGTDTQIDVYL